MLFFASSIWPLDKGRTPLPPTPYFTVFWMYLSVSMQIVTIKNHFQWWQFSKHTVTPVAIYELCLGGSANGRTNTVLYVHNSGYLVHRGTSPTFCENKKPFPWLFTDDLQRISKSFEHGWTKQLLRIQINGLRPCFFHKLRFGRCRNETCCRLMLSIKAVVRRKPCLISILPTCSLEVDSLSVITAESFLVFRFQPWSHGLWWAFCPERSLYEQWNEDNRLHLYGVCTGMCQSIWWIMHVSAPLIFPKLIFISCISSVRLSLTFQIFRPLQMYLL